MALKATICRAALQVADMDRNYYAEHALTVARHPSETDERMMVRLLAFALNAHEHLAFGKGLSDTDEPDLWQKDLTGAIELWIDVGLPDERAIRQACHRAKQVVVYTYGGRKADLWWEKIQGELKPLKNLTVIKIAPETTRALAAFAQRYLNLHCSIQDGAMSIVDENGSVPVEMAVLKKGETEGR